MEKKEKANKIRFLPAVISAFALLVLSVFAVRLMINPKAESAAVLAPAESTAPETAAPLASPDAGHTQYQKTSVVVDGAEVGVLMSREAAETLLDELTEHFSAAVVKDNVVSVQFLNNITLLDAPEGASAVTSDELFQLLTAANSPIRVELRTQTATSETIPFQHLTEEDASLPKGTRIIESGGADGAKMSVCETVYVNGVKTAENNSENVVITNAQNEVIVTGTMRIAANAVPGKLEGKKGKSAGALSFAAPSAGRVLLYFGGYHGRMHYGVDYSAKAGDDVRAAEAGTVVSVLRRGGYGLTVEIDHGSGFVTRYAHLQEALVSPGDNVKRSDVIAKAGESGNTESGGPELHFELRIDGIAYNPSFYLS